MLFNIIIIHLPVLIPYRKSDKPSMIIIIINTVPYLKTLKTLLNCSPCNHAPLTL